jgi:SAM-dependent methyltransferase
VTDAARIGALPPTVPEAKFVDQLRARGPAARVLELGTLRWEKDRPTHHREWSPEAAWTLSDIGAGTDVDVVADAHTLQPFDGGLFDAYVAVSLYEHLRRPWQATQAAYRVLKPGGLLYVATHQTFPLHGYPSDYFRFSREALAGIFEDAHFEIVDVGYAYPCKIEPPPEVTRWNRAPDVEAWLNVEVFARRPA